MPGSDELPLDVVYLRDAIGVVGLISAWNYPINVAFRKVAPLLAAAALLAARGHVCGNTSPACCLLPAA